MKRLLSNIVCILLLANFFQSCHGTKNLSLDPPNARPVFSIEVADATEVDLLQQQLGLEIVRAELPVVYFYGDKQGILSKLEEIGYKKPQPQQPDQFYYQYGKLVGAWDNKKMAESGLKIINRERDHTVVYGNLANLKTARSKGISLLKLDYEIRPREIEVPIKTNDDVQTIANLHVDIITVGQPEKGGTYVVQGTAFDAQIDELKKLGFTVTRKQ